MSEEDFCRQFADYLVSIAGTTFADGSSVRDYGFKTAPSYFEDETQRAEGPEACASSDFSYWED